MKNEERKVVGYESAEECDYTREEVIAELDGYLNEGKRIFPIELAFSALYWLNHSEKPSWEWVGPFDRCGLALMSWLGNDDPNLPDSLIKGVLHWLRNTKPKNSGDVL